MSEVRLKTGEFAQRRLLRCGVDLPGDEVGAILVRELLASIVTPGDRQSWRRRPSISADGTPVILSSKIGWSDRDALRLLVEPGSLSMTVAQQVAFSLTRVGRLLGLLGWGDAIADINAITSQVFPSDAAATCDWWGGIWLGASIQPSAVGSYCDADLRLYLNLRHGDAAARWRRLGNIISSFSFSVSQPCVEEWLATVAPHGIPVGIGIVVASGQVCAIRVYVGVYHPTIESLGALSLLAAVGLSVPRELGQAHDSFTARFGVMSPQSVTVGYDIIRGCAGITAPMTMKRLKVDICCHLIQPKERSMMSSWITYLLRAWSFESDSLAMFIEDVHAVWAGSEIQFLSLGFAPSLEHVTVYVKPCA